MTNQEMNRMIAERVMGWHSFKDYHNGGGEYTLPDGTKRRLFQVPRYTTDPAADYAVLVHVRETWDKEIQEQFGHELFDRWCDRWRNPFPSDDVTFGLLYEPGDFSKAALAALGVDLMGKP